MKQKLSQKRILILSVLIVMIAFASSSFVLAQDGGEEPTRQRDIETQIDTRAVEPGGPGFITISPHAFQPGTQTTPWAYFVDELYNPDASGSFYYASVSLPHNAIINKVVAYFYDASVNNIDVRLKRKPLLSGGSPEIMAEVTSNGIVTYNYAFDNSIALSTVNLQEYTYFIEVFILGGSSNNLTLTGVRIDYEYPGYLPCVTK